MMQVGGTDAGGFRDGVDFRLRAPMSADMGDGAPHDVVIGRRGGEVGKAVGQNRILGRVFQGHGHAGYLGRPATTGHPISGYSNVVRIGPHLASLSALPSSAAKLAFSSGLRKLAMVNCLPRETSNSRSMPKSSCATLSSLTQSGLSTHSRARPRWLTLRTVSREQV